MSSSLSSLNVIRAGYRMLVESGGFDRVLDGVCLVLIVIIVLIVLKTGKNISCRVWKVECRVRCGKRAYE